MRIIEESNRFADVDIIMPTLNSERTIEAGLDSIRRQKYDGRINIVIVDGGSVDQTLEIAKKYDCKVHVKKGAYMNGVNGAYNFAIKHSSSDFILRMDSDNILCGENFLSEMVKPLMEDPTINLSISVKTLGQNPNCFEQFEVSEELNNIRDIIKHGTKTSSYYVVEDLDYGLTNCAVFRRRDYLKVGDFVSDVTFLEALRVNGLSKAAIIFSANFYSPGLQYSELLKKMYRRYKKVANSLEDLKILFPQKKQSVGRMHLTLFSYFKFTAAIIYQFIKYRDRVHACGVIVATLPFVMVLIRPVSSFKIYTRYIRKMTYD